MARNSVLAPVVFLARFQDEGIELVGAEILALEDVGGQARLEELPARQSGDDVADLFLLREVHCQGVDRLEAAVAHVGEAFQAVDEDIVHVRRGTEDVIDA